MAIKIQMIVTTIMMKIMMKQNSIQETVTGAPNDTQHQNNAHPKTSPIGYTVMGCCWPMYNVTGTHIHTMAQRTPEHTTESTPEIRQYQIIEYTSTATPTPGTYVA